MEESSHKINEIAVVEYMYQISIARCIKNEKNHDETLVKKVNDIIAKREEKIKQIT